MTSAKMRGNDHRYPHDHNGKLGRWGEGLAEQAALERGYRILCKNVRTPFGEIDLIAQAGEELVFIEVKTRSNAAFGEPEEAISKPKARHLIASCETFLQLHPELPQTWRIDVVAIKRLSPEKEEELVWFEDAIHG